METGDEIMMTIGEKIKAIRKQKGMTQAQLAESCGFATVTIRQYESGKREPRYSQVEKIASALDVTATSLYPNELSSANAFLDEWKQDGLIIELTPEEEAEEERLSQERHKKQEEELQTEILESITANAREIMQGDKYNGLILLQLIERLVILKPVGLRKVRDYADDLATSGKYMIDAAQEPPANSNGAESR